MNDGTGVTEVDREGALRARLGVPRDAARVLILGESSHWDPNWLYTSEEYYQRRIEPILEEVLVELDRDPKRVFSLEAVFFLRMYWERRPDRRERMRQLIDERRVQLTGTGLTTPDAVLPSTESILRDYLIGQEWMRANGIHVEPRLAYLPDDFGCSPELPAILASLGFDRVGLTRIDGGWFVGADYRLPSSYPLRGSSAELLEKELKTADFVWRASDGSEALCHWNAFTYFQGDMFAHLGIVRWMGTTFGVPWRTGSHVAGRVAKLVKQLTPLALTPYLFCPIGCDFNGPIHALGDLLDRYNRERYPDTGTWVVSAGMDDYLDLVDCRRDRLPTLQLDPNPYWMGFYATRPNVKRLSNRVARKLVLAEKLAFGAALPREDEHEQELEKAWDLVALSNHHDLVTGTSPERVFLAEQLPWLRRAEELADSVLGRVRPAVVSSARTPRAVMPEWKLSSGALEVVTPHYALTFSEEKGGCIVSLRATSDGAERLAGPGNDLVAYADSGGLWRMGHEYFGGRFREVARASDKPARLEAKATDGGLEVTAIGALRGHEIVRRAWLRADAPVVRMHVDGVAATKTTIACRFAIASAAETLTMNVPGGVVERPAKKIYDPTFWPARSFAHLVDPGGEWGLAAFLGGPACVGLTRTGMLEWVVLRNAPMEKAFGVLPLPAHPASGVSTAEDGVDYAILLTGAGDYRVHGLPWRVRRALRAALDRPGASDLDELANAAIASDHDDVLVSAIKRASRGEGWIVRLRSYSADSRGEVLLRCARSSIVRATLCDARERDLGELEVRDGAVRVPLGPSILSVRLVLADA